MADQKVIGLIGSDQWTTESVPDHALLLAAVAARVGTVGGICAGTLARAGLFHERKHTSNSCEWILEKVPGYAGAKTYQDVPLAVADGQIVSASGSAPGTFAVSFLETLLPDRKEQFAQMCNLFAREHHAA